ncbi:MAG TPA: MBL fold metallo-hydrolase [Streptosporangiaceae bacterium]|jgi:glyoxylase-like metal-dependent hydrolase (beta-lactamase superfamily II)
MTHAITLRPGVHLVASGPLGISHPLDCHAYLVETDAGPYLIDTGVDPDAAGIRANIEGLGVALTDLRGILLTHAHADHAGGVRTLAAASGAPVRSDAAELRLLGGGSDEALGLRAAKENGTYPADYRYPHFDGGRPLAPDWRSGDGERRLSAIPTPGHSPGSTCYLFEAPGYRALFSGDTLFLGGFISLLNVAGCDPADYRRSVPPLGALAVDGLFPGHYLFAVQDGQQHIDLAIERLRKSVFPNVALGWLPYPQL